MKLWGRWREKPQPSGTQKSENSSPWEIGEGTPNFWKDEKVDIQFSGWWKMSPRERTLSFLKMEGQLLLLGTTKREFPTFQRTERKTLISQNDGERKPRPGKNTVWIPAIRKMDWEKLYPLSEKLGNHKLLGKWGSKSKWVQFLGGKRINHNLWKDEEVTPTFWKNQMKNNQTLKKTEGV